MKNESKKQGLFALFLPIFAESLLITLVNIVDTAMVSSVSDTAVGAVGSSCSYLNPLYSIYSVVSVGAGAIMSRFVGAKREGLASKTLFCSLFVNTGIGVFFSLLFLFFAGPIMTAVGTNPGILDDAVTYSRIVGASSVFVAVNLLLSAYLRAFGKPKFTMISGIVGNLANVGLNALFLSRGMGVAGVAYATMASRIISLLLSVVFILRIGVSGDDADGFSAKRLLSSVLSIGLPAAGESFLFALCNSVSVTCINQMDATGIAVTAYSCCSQITGLFNCIVVGFAQANGILVGWNIGAGDLKTVNRIPYRVFLIGAAVSLSANLLVIPFARPILSLLSESEEVLAYGVPILSIHLARLLGILGNNVYGTALKTAGDARILLLYGLIAMPLWTFLGSFVFGICLGFGLYGFWVGAAMDELSRCVLMFLRWRSRKWEKRCIAKA